jgi:SAM-dependent methyltransferase
MKKDREKWDRKYLENPELLAKRAPSKMVAKYAKLAPFKEALDIACGGGRHLLYLASLGFRVDGIDISKVAIKKLAKIVDKSKIELIEADLDSYKFEKNRYAFVVMSNYLDRDVIKRAKESLVVDGIFVVETYIEDAINQKPNLNPNFLLKKGELEKIFKDFKILEYTEFENEQYEKYRMKKAAIAAKRVI